MSGERHTRQNRHAGSVGDDRRPARGKAPEELARDLQMEGKTPWPKGKTPHCPNHPGRPLTWDGRRALWLHDGSPDCWTWTREELSQAQADAELASG